MPGIVSGRMRLTVKSRDMFTQAKKVTEPGVREAGMESRD
jgi:hypothetical protein